MYISLLRLHAGKMRNIGNLKRAARRCCIEEPMKKSLAEIRARRKVCKEKCNYSKKHADANTSEPDWNGPGRKEMRRQRRVFCA